MYVYFFKILQLAYKKNNYRTTTKTKLVKQKTTTLKPQQKVVSSFFVFDFLKVIFVGNERSVNLKELCLSFPNCDLPFYIRYHIRYYIRYHIRYHIR